MTGFYNYLFIMREREELFMNEFQRYLELHEIDPVHLSVEAHVRYQTVYNATKGDASCLKVQRK